MPKSNFGLRLILYGIVAFLVIGAVIAFARPTYAQTNLPSFLVVKNTDQTSLPDSMFTEVVWDVESFDTNGYFDLGTGRFTPLVAGKYSVTASVVVGNNTAGSPMAVAIYKNGTTLVQLADYNAGSINFAAASVDTLVDMNGTTDYLEVFVYPTNAANTAYVFGSPAHTYFSGFLAAYIPATPESDFSGFYMFLAVALWITVFFAILSLMRRFTN